MSSSNLRLLYNSGRMALGKTQVVADLGLHHPESPRPEHPVDRYTPCLEHHHPAFVQLILHRGLRLVASGHSQSLQATGLGKSLPLICQQQPRLNYKRKMYSTHTKSTPQVPSWGHKGGIVTGPYRTPTTLGHTTKTQSQSSST